MVSLVRLARLVRVTAAARDAELAALAALSRQLEDVKAQIASLRTGTEAVAETLPVAEAIWERGRTTRLTALNAEVAALLVRREAQIARSREAFGRSRAAEGLLARAKAAQAARRRRAGGG